MSKIVYLPLDERPCNSMFPAQIAALTDIQFVTPPASVLGNKKKAADHELVVEWLLKESVTADYAIASIDMLVYGGIVPSRLHRLEEKECSRRLDVLRDLKSANPRLRIYGFNLITRAPAYNSSEEEPDYYAEHGFDLFKYGWLSDKMEREKLTPEETEEWNQVQARLPQDVLKDLLDRRRTNATLNQSTVELVKQGTIDFLIIPLDDNSKYGFTAMEQRKLLFVVEDSRLMDRVHIYPGADEIGCTLFARVFCEIKQYRPEVFVRYSSTHGPTVIPKYEDRSLGESIKCHLTATGAFISDSSTEADVVLMVHSAAIGQYEMAETAQPFGERHRSYFSEVNYREFVQAIQTYAAKNKLIALADVAVCNGADTVLMNLVADSGLLPSLTAYAAWNTSGNSLGTVIAHAIVASYYRSSEQDSNQSSCSLEFYLCRLIEDWGYQSIVRGDIVANDLPQLGGDYFNIDHIREQVYALIQEKIEEFIKLRLKDFQLDRFKLTDIRLPWNRMFELDFKLELDRKQQPSLLR
ncbi:DUF4127 family protein [Cohnella sp.]|uniref:DUF4127 family protein n=1 Tax=Cohnella sp. TaxID=1883426 RepID=UPI003704B1CB